MHLHNTVSDVLLSEETPDITKGTESMTDYKLLVVQRGIWNISDACSNRVDNGHDSKCLGWVKF